MIQEYSITNPGYIEQIKKKIRSGTGETLSDAPQKKRLTTDEMVSLKSKTPTFGNTGATITLIEFSDFTCKYCHDFHNQQVLSQLEQTYSGVINRIYKNIP